MKSSYKLNSGGLLAEPKNQENESNTFLIHRDEVIEIKIIQKDDESDKFVIKGGFIKDIETNENK